MKLEAALAKFQSESHVNRQPEDSDGDGNDNASGADLYQLKR